MSNPDRKREKELLDQWLGRVVFDKPSKGVPVLKPEEDDE